jgi:hypothetical protein
LEEKNMLIETQMALSFAQPEHGAVILTHLLHHNANGSSWMQRAQANGIHNSSQRFWQLVSEKASKESMKYKDLLRPLCSRC